MALGAVCRFTLFLILLLLVPALGRSTGTSGPRVTLDTGVVQGKYIRNHRRAAAFIGIPYASAPVGNLRWRPPRAVKPWKGIRPATRYGPSCPQPDENLGFYRAIVTTLGGNAWRVPTIGPMSEDCLYLNVWTTNLRGRTKQPVMVWIHGGGGYLGHGRDEGANLTGKGIVAVTFNYRLGFLGFLALPALTAESPHHSSGNYGTLDQIAALEWVRRNIAAFGGDPKRVTIYGQSSGGSFVGDLMASPLAHDLFQRAIIQSGSPFELQPLSLSFGSKSAEATGLAFVKRLGVTGPDVLAKLRGRSVGEIIAAQPSTEYDPPIDGWVIPEEPAAAFAYGRQADVPLMTGSTDDETTVFVRTDFPQNTNTALRKWLKDSYAGFELQFLDRFPISNPGGPVDTYVRISSADFNCAASREARWTSRLNRRTYLYRVSYQFPGAGGAKLGAFHTIDLFLLFGYGKPWGVSFNPSGKAVAGAMQDLWVQFARTGDPNIAGLPNWPAYDPGRRQYLDFGQTLTARREQDGQTCGLFDEVLASQIVK